MLSAAELLQIMPQCRLANAQAFALPLSYAMIEFDITTINRTRFFLAQVAHESQQLLYTCEVWGPTYAQMRYETRKDLGNCNEGDGKRFCGRGLIQITGRCNYQRCSHALFGDDRLFDAPELLEEPEFAARSAAWFWREHGLNELADDGDFARITFRINGSTRTLEQREVFLLRADNVIV